MVYHMAPNVEEHSFYVFADEPSNFENCTPWKFDVCIYTYMLIHVYMVDNV